MEGQTAQERKSDIRERVTGKGENGRPLVRDENDKRNKMEEVRKGRTGKRKKVTDRKENDLLRMERING